MLPATNGTSLYYLIITPENLKKADTDMKNAILYGAFLGANMMLQTFILYPFFHIYNYELCRKPTTPSGVPFVAYPHMMACYSLLLTTAALDNMVNFGLKQSTQSYRESDFLMGGNSVRPMTKLKAYLWNGLLSCGIITVSTAIAYPAEVKWRRYLVSVDNTTRDVRIRDIWRRKFKGGIWIGFWASCMRNGFGALLLNYHNLSF